MSTFRPYQATCPACGHQWQVEIARGLHITRLPDIREQLVKGTFQVFTCPACQVATAIEDTLVYTDFDRHEYIAVETAATVSWQAALARHQTVFQHAFDCGPPIAQDWGKVFKRRVVYGFRALREKIVLWDAGLDDRIVEAVKGDLARDEGESPREVVLRIAHVLDGGHLMFAVYDPVPRPADTPAGAAMTLVMPAPRDFWTAPAASYRARAADEASIGRDYPWLADDWFVDIHDGPSYQYA